MNGILLPDFDGRTQQQRLMTVNHNSKLQHYVSFIPRHPNNRREANIKCYIPWPYYWSMLLVVYTQSGLHCLHETSFHNIEYETQFTTSCTTVVDKLGTMVKWRIHITGWRCICPVHKQHDGCSPCMTFSSILHWICVKHWMCLEQP